MGRHSFEPTVMSVDRSGRVIIPQHFCDFVGWINGTGHVAAWLLCSRSSRYRLISPKDVESNPVLNPLSHQMLEEPEKNRSNPTEFEDSAIAILRMRLVPTRLSPPPPGWRLTLPTAVAYLLRSMRGDNAVAIMITQGYIEIRSVDDLRSESDLPFEVM